MRKDRFRELVLGELAPISVDQGQGESGEKQGKEKSKIDKEREGVGDSPAPETPSGGLPPAG